MVTFLTTGNLLFSIAAGILLSSRFDPVPFSLAFLAGLIWSLGGIFAFVGIKYLGITRAPGIWNPGKVILTMVFGIVIFNEIIGQGYFVLGIAVVGAALLSVGMISMIGSLGSEKNALSRNWLIAVILVSISWSLYTVPLKIASGPAYSKLLPMSLGMFSPIIAMYLAKQEKANLKAAITMSLSGIVWGIANYTSLIMFQLMGIGRGYALSQLAIVINTVWGVVAFKEVREPKKLLYVSIGAGLSILGGILIAVSD